MWFCNTIVHIWTFSSMENIKEQVFQVKKVIAFFTTIQQLDNDTVFKQSPGGFGQTCFDDSRNANGKMIQHFVIALGPRR